MVSKRSTLTGHSSIACDKHPTFSRCDALARMKAETTNAPPTPGGTAIQYCSKRTCRVLDHRNAMLIRNSLNRDHVGHASEHVNGHDGLDMGLRCQHVIQSARIHVPGDRIDVYEDCVCPAQRYGVGGRRPGVGSDRDSVAGADLQSKERQV